MFKIYLTAEQWGRLCKHDKEVAAEVEKQQPELYASLHPKKHPEKSEDKK